MADPLPLGQLSVYLEAAEVSFDIQRNDELSGTGDGRYWMAELAPPLWTVTLALRARGLGAARALDARLRALAGLGTFLFADPAYGGPAAGAPGAAVQLTAIGSGRVEIGMSGLPAGFALTAGDRLSIVQGTVRYFGEICGDAVASASGVAAAVRVYPPLPFSVLSGAAVELAKPVLQVFVPPGGHRPASFQPGGIGRGSTLSLLQKI